MFIACDARQSLGLFCWCLVGQYWLDQAILQTVFSVLHAFIAFTGIAGLLKLTWPYCFLFYKLQLSFHWECTSFVSSLFHKVTLLGKKLSKTSSLPMEYKENEDISLNFLGWGVIIYLHYIHANYCPHLCCCYHNNLAVVPSGLSTVSCNALFSEVLAHIIQFCMFGGAFYFISGLIWPYMCFSY